ncbi:hypothetical protein Tco_0036433, partial [Tanacetum coccineum]
WAVGLFYQEDVPSLDFLLPEDVEEFDCQEDGERLDPSDVPRAKLSRKNLDVLPNLQKPRLKLLQGLGVKRVSRLSRVSRLQVLGVLFEKKCGNGGTCVLGRRLRLGAESQLFRCNHRWNRVKVRKRESRCAIIPTT